MTFVVMPTSLPVPTLAPTAENAVASGPGALVSQPVFDGRVQGEGVQTRHPQLIVSPNAPPVHTYQDVNIVKPNLFIPRHNDVAVSLQAEHFAAVAAVDAKRVEDGANANKSWTATMRAANNHAMNIALLR